MDVVALGESMVTFLPSRAGRLADVPSFHRAIGGAESNVACVLAAAGHSARWVSRVGADGFGQHLVERITGYGVDTGAVCTDPDRPTGIYFRTAADRDTDAHEVAYYRAGSAASAMSVADVDLAAARSGRVLHLSGITAALSGTCLELMRELTAPRPGRPLVSFDVNHRPALWPDADGPQVLLELARRADIVFVGADEARRAWGLHGGRAILEALAGPAVVVVKQGRGGATAFERHTGGFEGLDTGGFAGWDNGGFEGLDIRGSGGRGGAGFGGLGAVEVEGRGAVGGEGRGADGFGGRGADGVEGRGADGFEDRGADAAEDRGTDGVEDRGTDGAEGCGADGFGGRGADGAEDADGRAVFVPAPDVDVVAHVGAGDAFAAGFLSATLRRLPLRDRLRHGHLFAAAALTTPGDLAAPPARDHADRLAALDDAAWGRLRLGPGWTQAEQAEEEANIP
ncbi:PfkB family carbohydrate kinase [Streptomyces echinatus]|uniref:PfkB family carbohydrate kinase n=1 Tax=Streptomyces echinatus TaxID=67293 RepID=UPI00379D1857